MKRLLIALFALVAFAAAGIVVAPSLIDWNGQRDRVSGFLASAFGSRVAIDGDLNLTLLPTPILSASNVRVGQDQGGGSPLTLSAVEVALAPISLLSGEFRVLRAILVDPEMHVERDRDGQLIWPIGSGEGSTTASRALTLDRVTVSNGRASVYDAASGNLVEITDVFAQFSGDLATGEASLTGSLQAAGIPITVDLLSRAQSGNGSLPVTMSLGIDGLDNELRYAGLIGRTESGTALTNLLSGRWDQLRLQGDLALRGSNLSEALVRLGELEQPPPAFSQPFALDARFSARKGFAETDKLSYSLGDFQGTGSLAWNDAESPVAVLTAVLNRFDLDSLLIGEDEQGVAPAASLQSLLTWLRDYRPSEGDLLSQLPSSEIKLSTERLQLFSQEVRNVRLRAAMADGALKITGFQATTPGGGDLRLRGDVNWDDGPATATLAASLDDAAFTPLATWLNLLPPGSDGPSINTVSLRGSIAGRPDDWRTSGLELTVDASRLTGSLAYSRESGPTLGFRLEADRLNLDSYRPNDAGNATWPWIVAHPWLSALREKGSPTTLNFDLQADEVLIDQNRLSGLTARGSIAGDTLSLAELSADGLAGATVKLSGRYRYMTANGGDATSAAPVDLSGSIATDDLAALADELAIELPPLPQSPASAELRARISGDLSGQLKASLTGTVADVDVNLGGEVDLANEPAWTGAVRLIHPDAATVLSVYLPDYDPPGAVGALDVFARLKGTEGDVIFTELIGKLGELVLAGEGNVNWVPDAEDLIPTIEASLRTGTVNLDDWLPTSPSRTFGRWSSARLSFDWLEAVEADIRLVGRTLNWDDMTLQEPAAYLVTKDGTLEVERFSAKSWGGRIGMSGTLAPASTGYEIRSRVDVVGVDAREFLNQIVGGGAIGGSLDFGATVESSGTSIRDWVGQLSGSALLAVREGSLDDMDLAEAAQWVAADEEPIVFLEGLRESLASGETPFQALNARMTVNQGRLHADELRIAALETIGSGSGSFDLNRWEVDLTTDFALRRLPSAPPLALRLEGAADRPQRRWLTEAVQAYVAQRAARALSDQFIEPEAQSAEDGSTEEAELPATEAALPVEQPAVQ